MASENKVAAPDWARNAVIYEVNIRQYTKEGTFDAFATHLPRLKKLGVNVIWLMPIHPIGLLNRKGSLGSYYSVQDYTAINSKFGNQNALKNLIEKVHAMDMHVILDWVANHTSHDHQWVKKHPFWHQRNPDGRLNYLLDWSDTANLNYDQKTMRDEMIAAMRYWVKEFNIDGFRCDFATAVPADFWRDAISDLQQEKPLLFLAEDARSKPLIDAGFHLNYGMGLYQALGEISSRRVAPRQFPRVFDQWFGFYSEDAAPMLFITNHDENSWRGTLDWRFGEASDAYSVLIFTLPGIPLIYSGQEAGLGKALEFFEKDTIQWRDHPRFELLGKLAMLKQKNMALHEFPRESRVNWLRVENKNIVAFERRSKTSAVQVFVNLSDTEAKLSGMDFPLLANTVVQSPGVEEKPTQPLRIPAWGYLVKSASEPAEKKP